MTRINNSGSVKDRLKQIKTARLTQKKENCWKNISSSPIKMQSLARS